MLQVMHGLQCRTVFYDVSAVVFSDNHHYKALIIDETGGKWTYDSMSPPSKKGKLMYRGRTTFGDHDKDICGAAYTARMVYYIKRVSTRSVPCESEVFDVSDEEDAPDAVSDELESPFWQPHVRSTVNSLAKLSPIPPLKRKRLEEGTFSYSFERVVIPEVFCKLPTTRDVSSPSKVFSIGSILNRDGEEASTPIATPIIPVVCFDTDGLFDYDCMFAGKSIRYVPDIDSQHYGGPDQYIDTMIRRVKQVDIEHHVQVFTYNIDSFLVGPSVIIYAGRPSNSEPVLANDWGWRVSSKDDIDRVDDNVALDVLERRGEEITALKQLALDNDLSHVCPGDPEAEAAYLDRYERKQRSLAKIDQKDCRCWDCTTLTGDTMRSTNEQGT